ncbi:MAG: hypothetical protein KDK26_04690 [Roseivivax sp.]|nr:hypothetical protein [Roseivivax sp.]
MARASRNAGAMRRVIALALTPAVIVFAASNFVNLGNLAFNMVFSRLMGPELFGLLALLLTIKLALLGVLGAVQSAVSQTVAAAGDDGTERALSRVNRSLLSWLVFPVVSLAAGLLLAQTVGARLFAPAPLLALLLAALPFGASLSLLRGVAYGRMNAGRIALSANVEMAVRLGGALVAWQAGLGIGGVVLAISLSIAAGWAALAGLLPTPAADRAAARPMLRILILGALPFALLQVAQVMALDGDIFLASALLPAAEAGKLAALSLVQRIQFFACVALASVLLPGVVIAARTGKDALSAALPVAALFGAVSLVLLALASVMPGLLIGVLVGPAYLDAAPVLIMAVAAAVAFTFSYLCATFLAALGNRTGIVLVLAGALVQLALMAALGADAIGGLLAIKLACQLAGAAVIGAVTLHAVLRRRTARRAPAPRGAAAAA